MIIKDRLDKTQWRVEPCPLRDAQDFIRQFHYARGGSNTAVYVPGLYLQGSTSLWGVAWWLPPTRVACESVDRERWKQVLALTRMAVHPYAPKNACTFMLARSVRKIRQDRRFVALVTYADESQGHDGGVYRAANWDYVGRTGPYPRWVNSLGQQVAAKATKNRTKAEMLALGHQQTGSFYKHKYVLRLMK